MSAATPPSARTDPAWVVAKINDLSLALARRLDAPVDGFAAELDQWGKQWLADLPKSGCPQWTYLRWLAKRSSTQRRIWPQVDEDQVEELPDQAAIDLVHVFCADIEVRNPFDTQREWQSVEDPELSASDKDELLERIELIENGQVLVDQRGVTRIALMPRAHGCWPVYFLDARRCVLLNPDLVAWIEEELASLSVLPAAASGAPALS